jgi:hypothetical protein
MSKGFYIEEATDSDKESGDCIVEVDSNSESNAKKNEDLVRQHRGSFLDARPVI